MRVAGLILAAGAGRRFGGVKQLAPLRGAPLLAHAIAAAEGVPAIERIVVVLGAHADAIRARMDLDHGPDVVVCEDWAEGQAASLRRGLRALGGEVEQVVVTLADQPFITPEVIAAVLREAEGPHAAVRATYDGLPGHPVLLKRELFPVLLALRGDAGARQVLDRVAVARLECAHLCRPDDVDTPEQLEVMSR